jgi:hypothetical protein
MRSPTAPEVSSIPNGTIHFWDTYTRFAATLTDSAPTKFSDAAQPTANAAKSVVTT